MGQLQMWGHFHLKMSQHLILSIFPREIDEAGRKTGFFFIIIFWSKIYISLH